MKQRMCNVFTRLLKNEYLARILANLGYFIIQIYYTIARCILSKKRNQIIINKEAVEKSKAIIATYREKPDMDCEIVNNKVDSNIELSIIVPAYNVEKYIADCIQSILNQKTTYTYEVIVVNDGATDGTGDILEQIKDERLVKIVQNNQGLSGARNTGINRAKGKYITFVDSDDMLCEDSIQNMMEAIVDTDSDIVVGGYYTFCDESSVKQNYINEAKIIENDAEQAVQNPGYAWGKIYKRDLFEKIRFPMDAWYEDTIICSVLYRMSSKIVVIDKVVYGYRINPNGISRTARQSAKSLDHYWVMENALYQAEKVGLENDKVIYNIALSHMSTFLFRRISLLPDEVVKSTFIMACNLLQTIRPKDYTIQGNKMRRDLEKSFETGNYKLWRVASFLI